MIRRLFLLLAIGMLVVLWTAPAGAQQYPPNAVVPVNGQPSTQVQGQVEVRGAVQVQNGPFAFTGSDSLTLVRIALGAIAVGGMLVLATRKRMDARYG